MNQPQGQPHVGTAFYTHAPAPAGQPVVQHGAYPAPAPAQNQYAVHPQYQGAPPPAVAPQPAPSLRLAVVDQRYVMQVPVNLKMAEKALSWSGDDFVIKDATTQQPWFKIDGKVFSLKSKKTLTDPNGFPLALLDHTILSLRGCMTVYTPQGSPLFEIRPQFRLLEKEMVANVRNLFDGSNVEIHAKAGFLGKTCSLTWGDPKQGGLEIGRITKSMSAKSFFLSAQDYVLTVYPGVDVIFCVLMALAFDERYHDKNG